MGNYNVSGGRMLPLHNYNETDVATPHAAIQSITMGVRFGSGKYAIGYIHKFSFEMKRDNKTIWQVEPYPNILGDDAAASLIPTGTFPNQVFSENTSYWPGEAIEVIPGKMGVIDITLDRYSVYTANLMAAMMRSTGAGVYDATPQAPHVTESAEWSINYVSILQQVRPFDIYQIFVSPVTGTVVWGRKFGGCWFTSIGETTPESDKNEPILENGKIQATYLRPLTTDGSLSTQAPTGTT